MDDLRWILAIAGAVVVVAIYLSGRFEREEWQRDRETSSKKSQSATPQNKNRIQQQVQSEPVEIQASKPQQSLSKESTAEKRNDGSKIDLDNPEQKPSPVEEENKSQDSDWEGVVDSAREPLIEDEIVAVEIPAEFSEYGEERRSESRLKLKSEKPVQQELILDIEPLVLVLTIIAKGDEQFNGADIKNILTAENINHGEMEIFHYHVEGEKDAVFSVASVVEPGTFDLENIDGYKTPGLSLFSQLPGPVESAEAFDVLLKKSRSIADNLNGQLCDDKRNLLTEQTTAHYRDRIAAFDHELVLARKKRE